MANWKTWSTSGSDDGYEDISSPLNADLAFAMKKGQIALVNRRATNSRSDTDLPRLIDLEPNLRLSESHCHDKNDKSQGFYRVVDNIDSLMQWQRIPDLRRSQRHDDDEDSGTFSSIDHPIMERAMRQLHSLCSEIPRLPPRNLKTPRPPPRPPKPDVGLMQHAEPAEQPKCVLGAKIGRTPPGKKDLRLYLGMESTKHTNIDVAFTSNNEIETNNAQTPSRRLFKRGAFSGRRRSSSCRRSSPSLYNNRRQRSCSRDGSESKRGLATPLSKIRRRSDRLLSKASRKLFTPQSNKQEGNEKFHIGHQSLNKEDLFDKEQVFKKEEVFKNDPFCVKNGKNHSDDKYKSDCIEKCDGLVRVASSHLRASRDLPLLPFPKSGSSSPNSGSVMRTRKLKEEEQSVYLHMNRVDVLATPIRSRVAWNYKHCQSCTCYLHINNRHHY